LRFFEFVGQLILSAIRLPFVAVVSKCLNFPASSIDQNLIHCLGVWDFYTLPVIKLRYRGKYCIWYCAVTVKSVVGIRLFKTSIKTKTLLYFT